MIRKFLPILIVFLYGCVHEEVRIRPDKRVTVSGMITTEDSFLNNIPVISYGCLEQFNTVDDYSRLGHGNTSDTGNFKFTSLDSYNSFFTLAINPQEAQNYNSDYTSVYLMDTLDRHGTYLNFERIILKKKFPVTLELTESQSSLISYRIAITPAIETFLIQNRIFGEPFETAFFPKVFEGKLDETSPSTSISFDYVASTNIILKYQIDGGEVRDTTLNLSEPSTYQIEF